MTELVDRPSGLSTWSRSGQFTGGTDLILRRLLFAVPLLLISGVVATVQGTASAVSDDEGRHYTNQWAVRIDGTDVDAQRLAQRHGFIYVDKVRIQTTSLKKVKRSCIAVNETASHR